MNDHHFVWVSAAICFLLALVMAYNGDSYYAQEFKWIAILLFFVGSFVGIEKKELKV